MIEINLLPGAGRKTRGRSAGAGLRGSLAGAAGKIKDPHLLGAVGCVVVAALAVGGMFWHERTLAAELGERETRAVQDSTRYAAVLGEKRRATAQRDSVVRQLNVIKAIDNNRYVWPHVMDEVSAALPSYTWLTSIVQTSTPPVIGADTARSPKDKDKAAAPRAAVPAEPVSEAMRFHLVGNTVDIQALTHFMKQLETSPFIQHVTLAKSAMVAVEGREVTQFELDAEYELPAPSAIRSIPVSLSVR